MKLLVFSDSHRYGTDMEQVIKKLSDRVYAVAHLGDGRDEFQEIASSHPRLSFYSVAGNGDWDGPATLSFHIGGKKIFMTHGHRYSVKAGYERISYFAEENEADICLFGHTHLPVIFYAGKTLMMNPGSISVPKGGWPISYGVVDIQSNGVIRAEAVGKSGAAFRPLDL